MQSSMYLIHCYTSLHIGTGDDALGIDTPIARRASTTLPFIPDSAVKGSWRSFANHDVTKLRFQGAGHIQQVFGPDRHSANDHAGSVKFTSGDLLCFPVQSFAGTFAWVTCPLVLRQYQRSVTTFLPHADMQLPTIAAVPDNEVLLAAAGAQSGLNKSALYVNSDDTNVVLEDCALRAVENNDITTWGSYLADSLFDSAEQDWKTFFIDRFAVIGDNAFVNLAYNSCEVRTRIAIDDETGAAKDTALWTQELIPAESIFWGGIAVEQRVLPTDNSADIKQKLTPFSGSEMLQIGGDATTGHGLLRWRLHH